MNLNAHRLWAGTALILAATLTETIVDGSWGLLPLVALGIMLVLTSLTPEGKRT